eukprot:NODE_11_length_46995_cov_0.451872.p3 type:complete len:774 gc:universal NODE_11_length_46995_cov_0.451872:23928-21607(-)
MQPFKSSPLRKQVSPSPSPNKTPIKTPDERLKFVSPKTNDLQNLQLFNLKRNHFLGSPTQESNDKENSKKHDLTEMIDPSHQAHDIMENTNIFKKKRRVTFQNSPVKPFQLSQPDFLFDNDGVNSGDDHDMQETRIYDNKFDRSIVMEETNLIEMGKKGETQLLGNDLMQETGLIPNDVMQETNLINMNPGEDMDNDPMQETKLITDDLMQETKLLPHTGQIVPFIQPHVGETSLLESTNLLTKTIAPVDTFNLDEFISLHNKKGPLEQPLMNSHLLNSIISEDTLKPVVETSTFFKQVSNQSHHSILHDPDESLLIENELLNSPIDKRNVGDSNGKFTASVNNDTAEDENKQSPPRSSESFPMPLQLAQVEILPNVINETPSSLSGSQLLSALNLKVSNSYPAIEQSDYKQMYQKYLTDFNSISLSSLYSDYMQSDAQEQLYFARMINNTRDYCTCTSSTSKLQLLIPILDKIETIIQSELAVYIGYKSEAEDLISSLLQVEDELDFNINSNQSELELLQSELAVNKTDLTTFEHDIVNNIKELDDDIDKTEHNVLEMDNELNNKQHESKTVNSEIDELQQVLCMLKQQQDALIVADRSNIEELKEIQHQVEMEWKWKITTITALEVVLEYELLVISLNYMDEYTYSMMDKVLSINIKPHKYDVCDINGSITKWMMSTLVKNMDTVLNVHELMMELTFACASGVELIKQLRFISRFYPVRLRMENNLVLMIRNDDGYTQEYEMTINNMRVKLVNSTTNSLLNLADLRRLFVK